jgi:hypothetical protein
MVTARKCLICGNCYIGDECLACTQYQDTFYKENEMPDIFKDIFGRK